MKIMIRFALSVLIITMVCNSTTMSSCTEYRINYTPKASIVNDSIEITSDPKPRKMSGAEYIKLYHVIAQTEQIFYGIPASITLGQGILESDSGNSRIAREVNNHFGIKCFSHSCARGHCRNYPDDHHKDFFRRYATAHESYRSHSMLLIGKRYKDLGEYESDDYTAWAFGLQEKGYATDKRYAEKLIGVIERYKLHEYDLKNIQ